MSHFGRTCCKKNAGIGGNVHETELNKNVSCVHCCVFHSLLSLEMLWEEQTFSSVMHCSLLSDEVVGPVEQVLTVGQMYPSDGLVGFWCHVVLYIFVVIYAMKCFC